MAMKEENDVLNRRVYPMDVSHIKGAIYPNFANKAWTDSNGRRI